MCNLCKVSVLEMLLESFECTTKMFITFISMYTLEGVEYIIFAQSKRTEYYVL